MKKIYASPSLRQEMFATADVITISFVFAAHATAPYTEQEVPEVDVDGEEFN